MVDINTNHFYLEKGINKNVANATEQLVVNRKTTTEGVGIKSDSTYIKLKNASLPTDTTPVGIPTQDYQDYVPFFIYLEKTSTTEERNRVEEEYKLYHETNLENLLRLMMYLVDSFRKYGILWGVGRGSSVASYILYLIGINRINPLKYDLNIEEFLR